MAAGPDTDTPCPCARCGGDICRAGAEFAVDGNSRHTLTNPTGHRFHVVCVSAAPGARPIGVPTRYWTWFPGRRWRRAWCRECEAHVGWLFESDDAAPFFALILRQVTFPTPREPE